MIVCPTCTLHVSSMKALAQTADRESRGMAGAPWNRRGDRPRIHPPVRRDAAPAFDAESRPHACDHRRCRVLHLGRFAMKLQSGSYWANKVILAWSGQIDIGAATEQIVKNHRQNATAVEVVENYALDSALPARVLHI